MRYPTGMSFEDALDRGDLERAATVLEELVLLPDTGGLWIPECYADLARAYDRRGRCDEAIAAMEQAIDHGWRCVPDARSDIAEFLLRAGRSGEAAAIWAELKEKDSDDVWLYNAAGLSYGEVGEHELAIEWLGHGVELAMRTGDPEGITAQLSASRRNSLEALGRDYDELEQRVEPFLEDWRVNEHTRMRGVPLANHRAPAHASLRDEADAGPGTVAALAWFPSGDYEKAIERWPSLADDWGDVPHDDYWTCPVFDDT
jgi:tetratricopeptide (TPR) repeat protein